MEYPTGTVTFLFTDIEGSTKLSQQYPEAMPDLLARHNEILNQAVETHNGYVFQVVGDSYAVSFHNANDALNAALQAQRSLHNENWDPAPIKVRMGIHTGAAQVQIDNKENKYSGYATIALSQRIMSAGHGGQILISSATENLLRGQLPKDATLRDMGEKNLKDIFLPERIYQLNVPELPSEFAPLNTYEKIRHNLPVQMTTFIGREKEVEQIKKRLEKNHLVTLTGSGGIGKTRLSIQVAYELLPEYPIGVWLVELAPLTDSALVPQSVCAALGVTPEGGTSALNALTNYMRSKKILLVVDNCEHLIDASAQLCDTLLHACTDLRIIASSREALGIEGENAYRVPSLSLPDSKSGLHVIEESEAVKLFMERATTILPEFELTESNASVIAQICQRLDGIALAIELAASRVKMLKVEQIATRLDDAFRLLTGGSRTALPRQQTLRALIDWSYNLLSDEERTFLRRLSVFMGGWTLEAAEAICSNADALDLLTHLVDKSLVSVDLEHGDEPRYYLLETVRQYAREKLVESENMIQLRDVHLDYYLKLAERIASELYTRKMPYWLDYLETEYDNMRASLEWAQEREVEAGLRLCNALFRLWQNRGEYRKEGLEWVRKFLKASTSSRTPSRAWGLYHASILASVPNYHDSPENRKWREECLFLAKELGEQVCFARILEQHGVHELFLENYSAASELLKQSLTEARQINDELTMGFASDALGRIASNLSDFDTARSLLEESAAFLNHVGDLRRWGIVLSVLGRLHRAYGEWGAAKRSYEDALSVAHEARSRYHITYNLHLLGNLALGIGNFDEALSLLNQARQLVQGTPDDQWLAFILVDLGEIARFQGNFDQAAALLTESVALQQWEEDKNFFYLGNVKRLLGELEEAKWHLFADLKTINSGSNLWTFEYVIPFVAYFAVDLLMARQALSLLGWFDGWNKTKGKIKPPIYQAEFDDYLAQAREQLSESESNAAWAKGQSMSQEQILALAKEVLQ